MMTLLQKAYHNFRWVRVGAGMGLLGCSVLLYISTGGFPPWAWLLLGETLSALPHLFAAQGLTALLTLMGLLLNALAIFVLWGTLLLLWWLFLRDVRVELRRHQHFMRDIREARLLAQRMILRERQKMYHEDMVQKLSGGVKYDERKQQKAQSAYFVAHDGLFEPQEGPVEVPKIESEQRETLWPRALPSSPKKRRLHLIPFSTDKVHKTEDDLLPFFHLRQEKEPLSTIQARQTDELATLASMFTTTQERHEEEIARLSVGVKSHPGIVRQTMPNEDNLLALQGVHLTPNGLLPVGLFAVADGMGGHAHGREASRLAIQAVGDTVSPVLLHPNTEEELYAELLRDGVQRANFAIYQRNRQQAHMMGTTLTAALVFGSSVQVVNVGDSRVYLYRPASGLMQITRDHSIVARLVEKGIITSDTIYTHPRRNQIYRCLGENPTVELDSFSVTLQTDNVLLLCSDGLWEMVHDDEIEEIIRSSAPEGAQISETLLRRALEHGGEDNISIIAVYAMKEQ